MSKGFSADEEADSAVEGRDLSTAEGAEEQSMENKKTEDVLKDEG